MKRSLVLGSSSPYRRALLDRLGLAFAVHAADIDESPRPGEPPADTARRLAEAKARAVAASAGDSLVIGSDQVAAIGGLRLQKPGDSDCAVSQLLSMRGKTVLFHTAVCVVDGASGGTIGMHCDETRVTVRSDLSETMVRRYVALDRPFDCAGSARVEALGIALLERCESLDPTALIGLPMIALSRILRECGIDPLFADAPEPSLHP